MDCSAATGSDQSAGIVDFDTDVAHASIAAGAGDGHAAIAAGCDYTTAIGNDAVVVVSASRTTECALTGNRDVATVRSDRSTRPDRDAMSALSATGATCATNGC